jgi:hypothetical protein
MLDDNNKMGTVTRVVTLFAQQRSGAPESHNSTTIFWDNPKSESGRRFL